MDIINIIGTIGSAMLAICGLPQAIQSIKSNSSSGISSSFIILWGVGEILVTLYVLNTTKDTILLINYIFNIVIVGIIAFYKIKSTQ
jgi:uncharacterized protein with PQ loop repeat